MVERSLSMREAQGSIPCSSTFFVTCYQACSKPDFEFETPGTMSSINASGADTTKNCLSSRRKQKETKDGTEGSPRLSHSPGTTRTSGKIKRCLDRGSNTGPLDLQSNALPTELSKQLLGGARRTLVQEQDYFDLWSIQEALLDLNSTTCISAVVV